MITAQNVNLTNCDREQIHIPGSIQPHGMLLALDESDLKIIQVSTNSLEILGIPPQELLQKRLSDLLAVKDIAAIQKCLSTDFENVNPLLISTKNHKNQSEILNFDGIVHRDGQVIILELELKQVDTTSTFLDFYQLVKKPITKMQSARTLSEMCEVVVNEVRRITGFERVMIYRFDDERAGTVIAESKIENLTPYLGLRYPANDIPQPARQLYRLNLLRIIPDVDYQPVSIIPVNNPLTNEPIDLSYSVLRSVSPIHIEYLHNMGVGASMSISLLKNNQLWGLIACHHSTAKYIHYEMRTICEFLGQAMAMELSVKEDNENLEYKFKLKSIQSKFVDTLSRTEDLVDGLLSDRDSLLQMVDASGVALYLKQRLICIGKTPDESAIYELIDWVGDKFEHHVFYTNSLPKIYPTVENVKDTASGLLVLSLSKTNQNYILWFRQEVIQTVNWGGNPTKSTQLQADGTLQISPRKSFDLWKETVRLTSLPWLKCEVESVLELRSSIVGILLNKVDELARINLELERSNQELDSFAYIASHDLKEPLRGIHNYSSLLIEDYGSVLDAEGIAKLQTLARLTQRMEDLIESLLHFSRLGRIQLNLQYTNLNDLVKNVLDVLKISQTMNQVNFCIPRKLPTILCDAIQVNELFSNLISNAIKYNDKEQKCVEIGYITTDYQSPAKERPLTHSGKTSPVFYIRDNGIGIAEKHRETIFRIFKRLHAPNKYGGGTGVGLTIAKKIVERHQGKIWVESTAGVGSTFYFTLQAEEEANARSSSSTIADG